MRRDPAGEQERERQRERERDRQVEAELSRRYGGIERLLAADATSTARRSRDRYHIEFGSQFRIVVAGLWLLTFAAIVTSFLAPGERPGNELGAKLALISMAAIPAIWMHATCIHFALAFDAEGLHVRNRWGRWTMFPWQRVHSVRLSRKGEGYTVLLRNHPPIEVSLMMSGQRSLFDEIRRRTRPDESGATKSPGDR